MSDIPRPTARDFDPEVLRLFDQYVHGDIDRRGFLSGTARIAGGMAAATGLLAMLAPQFAAAQQVKPDDPRIEELANATADHFLANPGLLAILTSLQGHGDDADARYGMIRRYGHDRALAWARLTTLLEEKLRSAGVPIPNR